MDWMAVSRAADAVVANETVLIPANAAIGVLTSLRFAFDINAEFPFSDVTTDQV
jgi:hypothetical protein